MSDWWAIAMLLSGGLFAGGALSIAWERLPAWNSADPFEFRSAFAHTLQRVDRLQPALAVLGLISTIRLRDHRGRRRSHSRRSRGRRIRPDPRRLRRLARPAPAAAGRARTRRGAGRYGPSEAPVVSRPSDSGDGRAPVVHALRHCAGLVSGPPRLGSSSMPGCCQLSLDCWLVMTQSFLVAIIRKRVTMKPMTSAMPWPGERLVPLEEGLEQP